MNSDQSNFPSIPPTNKELLNEFADYRIHIEGRTADTVNQDLYYSQIFIEQLNASTPQVLFERLTFDHIQAAVISYKDRPVKCFYNFAPHVRTFLRYCYYKGYAERDLSPAVPTARRWRYSKLPKGIPPACIPLLYDIIDDSKMPGIRDMAIFRLLITYGVRGAHIRQLKLEDINWTEESITFPGTKRGKAIKQYLTPDVGNALLNYLKNGRPYSDYAEVFLSSAKPYAPLTRSSVLTAIVGRYLKRGEITLPDGVSHGTHSFRHAFGARLVGKVPIKNIADMLGHRSLMSTFHYSKVNLEELRQTAQPWPEVGDE